jgi:hypothetical protein
MKTCAGLTLLEVILSIALGAILVTAVHQHLSLTLVAAESAGARMRCLVTANNILEQAHATPGTFSECLVEILNGGPGGNLDQWYEVPAAYSSGGIVGSVSAMIRIEEIQLDSVATSVAVVLVKEDLLRNEVRLQAFRSPLE